MKVTIELPEEGLSLKTLLVCIEMDLIQQALASSGYVKAQAARLLQLKRTTLMAKMRKFGMKMNLSDHGKPAQNPHSTGEKKVLQ